MTTPEDASPAIGEGAAAQGIAPLPPAPAPAPQTLATGRS